MKRALSIFIVAIALLAFAGCSKTEEGAQANVKAANNLKNGYNLIQPDVSLGTKRDEMPDGTINENASDTNSGSGFTVEYDGTAYHPYYNWLGKEGLSLIEYNSSAKISAEKYNVLLRAMNEQYGESRLVSDVMAEQDAAVSVSASPEADPGTITISPSGSGTPAQWQYPGLTWQYENVSISLFYRDGYATISMIMNEATPE